MVVQLSPRKLLRWTSKLLSLSLLSDHVKLMLVRPFSRACRLLGAAGGVSGWTSNVTATGRGLLLAPAEWTSMVAWYVPALSDPVAARNVS
jgi:hypothetical protein